jgi:DNA-binding response OmpR family regulator
MPGLTLRIAVLDDEADMVDLLRRMLTREGYVVIPAADRAALLQLISQGEADAVILDLGLPGDDGVDIARTIRSRSRVPLLMVTGRGGVADRVLGLDAGADDYLSKPFVREELLARLRAVLRRAESGGERRKPDAAVVIGGARLDLNTRALVGPGGRETLTEREAVILLSLARANGVLARETIYREVFAREWSPWDRSLDVHISNLRRKLAVCTGCAEVIEAARAAGYRLLLPTCIEQSA